MTSHELADLVINTLLQSEGIDLHYRRTLASSHMEPNSLNFQPLFDAYIEDLKTAATLEGENPATELLQGRAQYMADRLVTEIGDPHISEAVSEDFPASAVTIFSDDAYLTLCAELWYLIDPSSRAKLTGSVSELWGCDQKTIRVSSKVELGLLDKMKIGLEKYSGVEWIWWPLVDPTRPLSHPKFVRISWKCAHGDELSADVPLFFAELTLRKYRALAQS